MNIFFTADSHFGHFNIIRHTGRPFSNAHEMNRVMTEKWNSQVKRGDQVYHLGDFAFRGQDPDTYAAKLNGKIHLVRGNHDRKFGTSKSKSLYRNFVWVKDYYELKTQKNKQFYVLSHYPFQSWNKSFHGSIMLHGHCHNNISYMDPSLKIKDVGVDTNDFFLYSEEQILDLMR